MLGCATVIVRIMIMHAWLIRLTRISVVWDNALRKRAAHAARIVIVAVTIVVEGGGVCGVHLSASRGSTIVQHVTRSSLVQRQFHKN